MLGPILDRGETVLILHPDGRIEPRGADHAKDVTPKPADTKPVDAKPSKVKVVGAIDPATGAFVAIRMTEI